MTGWAGPSWDDPMLTELAVRLRDAHRQIDPLPVALRRRLHRQLLTITDLAKRDSALAAGRLEAFLAELAAQLPTAAATEPGPDLPAPSPDRDHLDH